jgi:3D (Asp-Asp-Asp) domain-containing protein
MSNKDLEFQLPEPSAGDLGESTQLWGTYYYIKTVTPVASGIPLRDMNGDSLGVELSQKAWCLAGVEGTLAYENANGTRTVLNYAGRKGSSQTICDGYTSLPPAKVRALEKTRWGKPKGPYGDGANGYLLSPYRTLAVDKSVIPLGTAVYIAQARGITITLPDGSRAKHDGYFFAADVGGAISGQHVDFFLGFSESNPFPFVTSSASGKFGVVRVTNVQTVAYLKSLHRMSKAPMTAPQPSVSEPALSGSTPVTNTTMNEAEKKQLYTIRWYIREKWGEASAKAEVMDLLGALLDPSSSPEERPSVSQPGGKLLWCPFAERNFKDSRTQGSYAKGYPLGAIVHFTAGRRSGLEAGMDEQVKNGYTYFVIDKDGNIGQNFPLDSWGSHAGQSSYPGLEDRVSDDLVGIEIQAAGRLEKNGSSYKTWYGESIPAADVRTIAKQTANQEPGHYHKYTAAQEASLIRLLTWLYHNNPDVFKFDFVLGHDEVSPKRKNDPGGALSMTMPDLRKKLKTA